VGDAADEYDWVDYISPEEIDDANPDEPGTAYGFFQTVIDKLAAYQPPSRPMTTERIADMFGVPAEYVGKASDHATSPAMDIDVMASKHMPKDTSYVFSADPTRPEQGMVLMLPWAQYPTDVPQKINNPKEKYTMDMAGIAKLRGELEEMLAKVTGMVAVVERFGGEPGEGTVIKFEHTFRNGTFEDEGKTYEYVAVRKFGKWFMSGRSFAGRAVKWAELLEFIGEGRAWVCSEFTEVPLPGAAAESGADKAAAVASLLANADGRDTAEVAAEVVALLESK
jgi:hypothetical protein